MCKERANLYKKINLIMRDVEYLKKDDSIKFGNTSYKGISEEKVTSIIREAMVNHGVCIFPVEQEHIDNQIQTKNGTAHFVTVNVKYKIVDMDTGTGEIIVSSGTGVDTQDKGVGKAMTYAYKYMLLRTFAIPTGEDPDRISSEEITHKLGSSEVPKSTNSNGRNSKHEELKEALDLELKMPFGKHKGEKVVDIFKSNNGYVEWLAEHCGKEDIKAVAKYLLSKKSSLKFKEEDLETQIAKEQSEIEDESNEGLLWDSNDDEFNDEDLPF